MFVDGAHLPLRPGGAIGKVPTLGDKIVEGMNAWSVDLAGNIRDTPETNIQLQTYTNSESRFTRVVPVTRI